MVQQDDGTGLMNCLLGKDADPSLQRICCYLLWMMGLQMMMVRMQERRLLNKRRIP